MAAAIIPWVTIAMQAEPELVALVQSLMALRKKYPNLTPAMVQQIAGQADTEFDSVLSKIAADQASHPVVPK